LEEFDATPEPQQILAVRPDAQIPVGELRFRFSRSSGPGGQHVNRSATRVELLFDVAGSPSLSEDQRRLILTRLSPYIDKEGVLHLTSQSTRSQWRNREELLERLRTLLAVALTERRQRRPTRPSRAARERRLASKKRRSETKHWRKPPDW